MKKFLLTSFALLLLLSVMAQERGVSGKVTSAEDGTPLPGVSVVLKGTVTGTTTDSDGAYSLQVPANGGSLIFSFIGLRTSEVIIGDRTTVDVNLALDVTQLSEVVVTGVGVATDKKKLAIAVESVTSDKLPATPSASIDQALVGKIAGAQISSVSGNPGDQANIVLRGINTVQGGTKPLIMIDGIQVATTDINSIDMSMIDHVEVIQGAASATLYGAQGANGVIQLFTKKGKSGKLMIDFSSSYSQNQFLNIGNVRKADKHPYLTNSNGELVDGSGTVLDYNAAGNLNGISYEFGGPARYAIQNLSNVADQPYAGNIQYHDHFKQVFQTGYSANNSLNISGGNDKTDFALALSNNNTLSPILKNGHVDRTNFTANVGTELFKGFKIRSITQLVYTKNNLHPGLGAAGGLRYGLGNTNGDVGGVYGFLNTSPFFDLTWKSADGDYAVHQQGGGFLSINSFNPYYRKQYAQSLDNKIDVIQNFEADYAVNKFIQLNAKYGINYRNENARWIEQNQTQNVNTLVNNPSRGYFVGPRAVDFNGEIDEWQYNNTFKNFIGTAFIRTDFQEDFGMGLPIQTSTQLTFDHRAKSYKEYDTYGLGLPLSPPINMQATSDQHIYSDYVEKFITYGYLVNQKIDVGDWGGVTAGFRSDYSSAFGGGSKPFTFPHFDGYLLPINLFANSSLSNILPYFKLRAAYGKAGIQPGPYDRYPVLTQSNLGSGVVYSTQSSGKNPNLNVEVSAELEIGTDFTIDLIKNSPWLNSIGGSVTYWKRQTDNAIFPVSAPLSNGTVEILTNAVQMHSNGIQFSLNLPIYSSAKLKWDLTTNFGHQISIIDKVTGGADIIQTSFAGSTSLVIRGGTPIGQVFGYKAMTSLDYKRQDGTRYIDPANEGNYEIVNGYVVDKSTYQIQFTDEQYPLGNPNPKFNMSFINNVTYRNLVNLSFQFDWVKGNHLYNQTKEWMYRDGIHSDFARPVTINGETGAYTAYWSSAYYGLWGSLSGAGNNATKDFFWEDASFVRLRNVSVAFNLENALKMKRARKLQLVFTGRNILTWTKYTGYDPEISSGASNSAFDRGVDHSTLPNIKSYQVGLNIGL